MEKYRNWLLERFMIERKRFDRSGVFEDRANGRAGRMILFRECLKHPDICPFIIRNDNRNKYIEGLMEYRETQKTDKIVSLMEKEAADYYQQCKYFMG